jgi:hypothetical protein
MCHIVIKQRLNQIIQVAVLYSISLVSHISLLYNSIFNKLHLHLVKYHLHIYYHKWTMCAFYGFPDWNSSLSIVKLEVLCLRQPYCIARMSDILR